jgi:diguanylate cyclase (GGDEF)-like protein
MPRLLMAGDGLVSSVENNAVFETSGYELIQVDNLPAAVSLVLEDPPDMLIAEKDFGQNAVGELIKAVKGCVQKLNIPILILTTEEEVLKGFDWEQFPVDDIILKPCSPEILFSRVKLAEARMARVFDNNPLTKLPGNTSILKAIQKALDSDIDFAVCYVDIDNFKPFNDRYGFAQGDEIILMVARIMVNVVDEMARKNSFVGHIGGDDYVFIVTSDKLEEVCKKMIANFEMVKNMFLSPEDIKAGAYFATDRQGRETRFELLTISISVVHTGVSKYKHSGEVATAASQVKHCVKKLSGSNYMIDRRGPE